VMTLIVLSSFYEGISMCMTFVFYIAVVSLA